MKVLEPQKTATKLLESESEPTINRLAEIVFDEEERLKEFIRSDVSDVASKDFAKFLQSRISRHLMTKKKSGELG